MSCRFIRKAARLVGLRKGYIKLPTVDATPTWLGNSSVFKQYNYSATKPFTLPTIPVQPAEANFALTIKYRVGTSVTRYKLWDKFDVLPQVPVYVNQIIKPNFCFELWSLSGVSSVVSPEQLFQTGIREIPTDYRNTRAFTASTEPEQAILEAEILREISTEDMQFWYVGDDLEEAFNKPVEWPAHNGIGAKLAPIGTPLFEKGVVVKPRTNFATARFGSSNVMAVPASGTYMLGQVFLAFSIDKETTMATILSDNREVEGSVDPFFYVNYAGYLNVVFDGTILKLGDYPEGPRLFTEDNKYYILAITSEQIALGPESYIERKAKLYSADGVLLYEASANTPTTTFMDSFILHSFALPTGKTSFAELIAYNANTLSETAYNNVIQYLVQRYHKGIHLRPPEFDPSAIWLDNADDTLPPNIDPTEVIVNLSDNFKDVLYLRNQEDNKYYSVILTTVNGQTTINVGTTPYDKI